MFQIKNRKVLVLQAEAKINEFRLRKRYLTLLVFFGLCFSVLMCRLFVLQVLMHSEYSEKAKDNIESETTLKAGRGVIYDRNMVPLTNSEKKIIASVSPTPRAVTAISSVLSGEELENVLERLKSGKPVLCRLNPVSRPSNEPDSASLAK